MPVEDNGRITLTMDDWNALLPGETFRLGKQEIVIRPLGLEKLSTVLSGIAVLAKEWRDVIVKAEKKNVVMIDKVIEYLPRVSKVMVDQAPELLSEMSNISVDDIKKLPIKTATELMAFCLEVNIKSQQGMEKNLVELADRMATIVAPQVGQPGQIKN